MYTAGDVVRAEFPVSGWTVRGGAVVWDAADTPRGQRLLLSVMDSEDIYGAHTMYVHGVASQATADGRVMMHNPTIESGSLHLVVLGELVGRYTPRDKNLNSVEIMREVGYERLIKLRGSLEQEGPLTGEALPALALITQQIHSARHEATSIEHERDHMVRRLLAGRVSAEAIAERLGVHRSRVYQIRDDTR